MTAVRDGFAAYDALSGPDLDAARWVPARLPLPNGDVHVALDPNAELAVGDGEVRVAIPRFSLSHDAFQAADSAKYLIVGTRRFELPPDRPVTFAVDLAVENLGGDPGDCFTRLRACEITLDRSRSTAVWHVDGHRLYEARGTVIPERASIGFGIWTMLPIRDGRSRSLDGQGLSARWRRFRHSTYVDAPPSR